MDCSITTLTLANSANKPDLHSGRFFLPLRACSARKQHRM